MENVADVYPLTPAQEGLLFHTLAEPGSGVYVDQIAVTLRGPLREEALKEAWRLAVERHPALRTAFLWDGLDQPLQVVRETVTLPWTADDWRGLAPEAVPGRLDALLAEDRAQGFDLAKAPLIRLRLLRTADDAHRLVWTFHHIALDGWSTATVLREVWADYAALAQGQAPASEAPRPFRDLVAWQRVQDLGAAEVFWRDALAGFEAPTPLGVDTEAASGAVAQREITLPADVTARLGEAARRNRVTLSTVVQGAWAMLLGRYSGERDVVFGTTVSGRPPEIAGVEAMVGMFINTLPVRATVDPEAGLWDTLLGLQNHALAARQFEHAPLARVQTWSDVPAGQSLFESLVVFENYPAHAESPAAEAGLRVEDADYREQSNYPLALLVVPGEALRLIAVHDIGRFEAPAVDRLLGHLATLLRGIADASESARLGDLGILTETERSRLRALASGPERSAISEGGVLGMIEAHARRTPETDAVVTEAGSLTYAELWAASGRLAGHLRTQGVEKDVPVGLCLPRTPGLVVGILGILRAGGAYVPLDPAHPDARLRALLEDAGAPVLVTQGRTLPEANLAVVDLDGPLDAAEVPPPPALADLAYVLYTSGSTGRPKGVPVAHRHLAHSTQARLDHYPEAVDRFLLLSSVAFDSSVAGLFWTLASGGALVLPAERQEQDVPALAALVARHGVTHTLCLPSLWRVILDLADPEALASLRRVILAGEALAPDVAAAHRARLGAALTNEYGPTEATVWATAHEVTSAPARVPIGRPIPGARAYVLDRAGGLAPVGVPGELALGGDGVVDGYLGRPEATAAAFGADPFSDGRLYRTGDRARWREDGALDFLGRADGQVKVRGHRIELGEVEAAIRRHPAVREAAASVVVPEAGGAARLVGYVVGEGIEVSELRAFLADRVPDYMVPSAVVVLDALPQTRTGKLDRKALPVPEAPLASGHVAPRTEAERTLAAIWAEVLGLESVGVTDNFFEIGGDSIASIQIISRANRAGLGLKPAQFFERPTVEALAAVAAAPTEAEAEGMPAGPVPLTPIQRWFFGLDLPDPTLWTQAVTVDLKADTDTDRLVEAVRLVAEAHDAFRLRFDRAEGGRTQRLTEPDAPRLDVARHDLAAIPEAERAEAAERIWTDAQAALDIERGPLLRADLLGPDPRRLILTAHHLIVDVVSWQVILSQIEDAYARLGAEKDAAVTASGTPFGRWAEALETFASSPEVAAERDVWAAQAPAVSPLPTDADGPNTERSAQAVRVGWGAAETQALTDATAAYGTNVAEVLLAAIAEAVGDWSGVDRVCVDLEGHGRDDLGGTVDVAETVGWFTTVYPVTLDAASGDPRRALIGAKEAVRGVPRQGLGYGLLRYGPAPDARLGDGAEILLNYLGRGQAPFRPASPFAGTPDVWGAHGPDGERAHLLEVVARIADGALDMRWTYSTERHRRETVERLARRTLDALSRLVDHALDPEAGSYTPSDFPDVDLGQDTLDALLDDFD